MKKTSFFASFFLATVTIVGCSSVQLSKPAFKPEINHKIENNTIDLGNSSATEVKLKLNFTGFSTKSVLPAFGSSGGLPASLNNSKLIIKLHKYTAGTPIGSIPSPKARFESGSESYSYTLSNIDTLSSIPLTIRGLQLNCDYYLSARLYLDYVALPIDIVSVNTSSPSNLISFSIGDGTTNLQIGDYVQVGADTTEYQVTGFTTGGFFVSPNLITTGTNQPLKIKRNIVGIGDSGINATGGNGMATTGASVGGGTIPAKTSGTSNEFEEYVNTNGQGISTINNDVATANQWDMNVQLMQDTTLIYKNNTQINVIAGNIQPLDLTSYYLPNEIEKMGNITFNNPQMNPSSNISDSGDIKLIWASNNGTDDDIKLRNYVDSTKTWSNEITVNSSTIGNQSNPSIASDDSANSVVVWTDKNNAPSQINFQRYNSTGTAQGSNQTLDAPPYNRDFAKVGMSRTNGQKFMIAWTQDENFAVPPDTDVYAQIFNNDGTSFGSAFIVNTNNSIGKQKVSHVSVADNGDFLISWVDLNTSKVYFRLYNSDGSVKSAIISLSDVMGITDAPKHEFDSFGNFIVVGRSAFGIYAQKFDISGQKTGNVFYVDNTVESFPECNEISLKVAKDTTSIVSWLSGVIPKATFVPLTKDLEKDDDPKMLNYSPNDLEVKTLNIDTNNTGDLFATWTVTSDPTLNANNQVFYRKFSKIRKKY